MSKVNELYIAATTEEVEEVRRLLASGHSPNEIHVHNSRNVALEMLDVVYSENRLIILDILIEYGLNIDYRDNEGKCLLLELLQIASLEVRMLRTGLDSIYELSTLKQIFDKIMRLGPIIDDVADKSSSFSVFEYAQNVGLLHWFEVHKDKMSEADKEKFETYRLAMAFEGNVGGGI